MYLLLLLAFSAFAIATTEHFTTNNRMVYASWSSCDACKCKYFSVYALEHASQNPSDTQPPVYIYSYHSDYDYCNNVYISEWFQTNTPPLGLEISRSGRSGELVISNMTYLPTGNNVSMSLSWSTKDSENANNCNCQSTYSYGTESTRINSKSSYRIATLTGSVTINGVVQIVPTETYSYITGHGQKTLTTQHH